MARIIVETKTLMINLMAIDNKDSLDTHRFLKLIDKLRKDFWGNGLINKYQIPTDINIYSIKRVVDYNSDLFELDMTWDTVYLKKENTQKELAKKYELNEELKNILIDFAKENPA